MIETLILGWIIGVVSVGLGAAYAIRKFMKKHYILKKLSDGCTIFVADKNLFGKPYHMIGIANKGEEIIGGIKFTENGVLEIVADKPKHAIL